MSRVIQVQKGHPSIDGLSPEPQTGIPGDADSGNTTAVENAEDSKASAKAANNEKRDIKCPRPLIYRDQIYDRDGRTTKLVRSAPKPKPSRTYSRCVLLVRRIFSEKMIFVRTEVDVKGTALLEELKALHTDTSGVSLGNGRITVDPRLLYWSYDALKQRLENLETGPEDTATVDLIKFQIRAALDFVDDEYSALSVSLITMLKEGKITFEHMWAILPPNVLVFSKDTFSQDRIYRVRHHNLSRTINGNIVLALTTLHTDSIGKTLGYVRDRLVIPEFDGAISVNTLPVYPIRYHFDKAKLWDNLLSRGKKQLAFHNSGHQLREYDGFGLKEGREELTKFKVHGRVILDAAAYGDLEPRNGIVPKIESTLCGLDNNANNDSGSEDDMRRRTRHNPFTYSRIETEDPSMSDKATSKSVRYNPECLPEEAIVILSGALYGYSLGDSEWGAFAISHIRDVEWNDELLDRLVMNEEQKELLYCLIKAHGSASSGFDDFVKDKGKGLVGLLLGAPGLGKTLTAEAIAETANMPLFMMSSGSLGSTASEINRGLVRYLELATRWKTVLLLDEADVFLAKRSDNDLERNAIISVFLREIEYYPGILILTTNRAQSIDSAFQSRIHFCHHYIKHGFESRKNIWTNFIDMARKNQNIQVAIDDEGLCQLAELDFNGRQIKNAMSIAVTLAASDKSKRKEKTKRDHHQQGKVRDQNDANTNVGNQDNILCAKDIIQVSKWLQNFNFKDDNDTDEAKSEVDLLGSVVFSNEPTCMLVDLLV